MLVACGRFRKACTRCGGSPRIVPMYLPWSLRVARNALENRGFFRGCFSPASTVSMSDTAMRMGAMRENELASWRNDVLIERNSLASAVD